MNVDEHNWVLVPGTLCTPDVFEPLLNKLGVAPDNRRFIEADAPKVADYETPLRSAVHGGDIVCGFSLGGLIVAHNLGALEDVKAVVLLASNPLPDSEGNRANREAARDQILAGGAGKWVLDNWAVMSTDKGEEIKNFVASMAEDTVEFIVAQTELAASRPGAEHALLETGLPLVFVTGSEDKLTPPSVVGSISKNARTATLEVIEDLGHFALLEAPDRVANAVLRGLAKVLTPNKERYYHEETINPDHAT